MTTLNNLHQFLTMFNCYAKIITDHNNHKNPRALFFEFGESS